MLPTTSLQLYLAACRRLVHRTAHFLPLSPSPAGGQGEASDEDSDEPYDDSDDDADEDGASRHRPMEISPSPALIEVSSTLSLCV